MRPHMFAGILILSIISTCLYADEVKVGDSREKVLAIFGQPKGNMVVGAEETLLFDLGQVDLKKGKVTSIRLTPQEVVKGQPVSDADNGHAGIREHSLQVVSETTPADPTPPATDWPQWRGPDRTGVAHNSPPLASAWPDSGPKKVWQARPVRVARCYGHNGGLLM